MQSETVARVERFLQELKERYSKNLLQRFDEAATKQAIILPILASMGWSIWDIKEVVPEYPVQKGRVDYALQINGEPKVFLEVKKIGEDLERHQEQLLQYAFARGIPLAVLTNGIGWWFYLPLLQGSWEQRKFYTIDLYDQASQSVAARFEQFLGKQSVLTGRAVKDAEEIYHSQQRQRSIQETLPKAWRKVVQEPDPRLVELLSEVTEELCGYRPDHTTVEKFLRGLALPKPSPVGKTNQQSQDSQSSGRRRVAPVTKTLLVPLTQVVALPNGTEVQAFFFQGKTYTVRSWKEFLVRLCELIAQQHRSEFYRVLDIRGRKRPYFGDFSELTRPAQIEGTAIFVETNWGMKGVRKVAQKVLETFGYDPERDVEVEILEGTRT